MFVRLRNTGHTLVFLDKQTLLLINGKIFIFGSGLRAAIGAQSNSEINKNALRFYFNIVLGDIKNLATLSKQKSIKNPHQL
jgi:hypothetical protein